MSSPTEDIIEEVRDPEFAKEYGEELTKVNVAVTMAKARKERGLTQEQLAEKAGTSQPYIAKLESGYANPSIGAVAKILAVMGFRLVPDKDSLVPEPKPWFHRSRYTQFICCRWSES
jgi:ribosome-binding protein aMBF1 (putative translation factor)